MTASLGRSARGRTPWPQGALLAIVLTACVVVNASAQRLPVVGVLSNQGLRSGHDACVDALRQGLADLGHLDGQTVRLDPRWWVDGPAGNELRGHVRQLTELPADVVVSMSVPSSHAMKAATSTIPIVLGPIPYPVEIGLIRRGPQSPGNVTGIALLTPELMQRRVRIAKAVMPSLTRAFVFYASPTLVTRYTTRDYDVAAKAVGVQLSPPVRVHDETEVAGALSAAAQAGAQAVILTDEWTFSDLGPMSLNLGSLIVQGAAQHRIAVVSGDRAVAEAGALIAHVPPRLEACRRAARFVDRILKGARPADLPLEPSTKFQTVINLRVARALGLTVPASALRLADEVIQ